MEGDTAVNLRNEDTVLPSYYGGPIRIQRGVAKRDAIEEWRAQARGAPQEYYQGMIALVCSLACEGLSKEAKNKDRLLEANMAFTDALESWPKKVF